VQTVTVAIVHGSPLIRNAVAEVLTSSSEPCICMSVQMFILLRLGA
jgi:hypothetical protein